MKKPILRKSSGVSLFSTIGYVVDEFFERREDLVSLGAIGEIESLLLVSDLMNSTDMERLGFALDLIKILREHTPPGDALDHYEAADTLIRRANSRFGSLHKSIIETMLIIGKLLSNARTNASAHARVYARMDASHPARNEKVVGSCPYVKKLQRSIGDDAKKCDDYLIDEDPMGALDDLDKLFAYKLALLSHIAQCEEHDDSLPVEMNANPPRLLRDTRGFYETLTEAYDCYDNFLAEIALLSLSEPESSEGI